MNQRRLMARLRSEEVGYKAEDGLVFDRGSRSYVVVAAERADRMGAELGCTWRGQVVCSFGSWQLGNSYPKLLPFCVFVYFL